jgi:hypothetical protein
MRYEGEADPEHESLPADFNIIISFSEDIFAEVTATK